MGSTYVNADGLVQYYGSDLAKPVNVAEVRSDGDRRWIEIDISADRLPASSAGVRTIASYDAILPAGALIEDVWVQVTVPFDSADDTATLNVGFQNAYASGGDDTDAFVAAASVAELTPTGVIKDGTSPADGSGRGTKLSAAKHVTYSVGTQAFTAGKGVVRVFYAMPDKATDTLGT